MSTIRKTLSCTRFFLCPLFSTDRLGGKKPKRTVSSSWRMDETYIKIKGEWFYLYRAVDKCGDTVDFILSERRDEVAATAFFKQAIDGNSLPEKVVIDKSGANLAGLENINVLGAGRPVLPDGRRLPSQIPQ